MFDNKVAVNVAYILGNSALRINAIGWDNRLASAAELDDMKLQLREGMEEGSFGMSTGLDYPLGNFADTAELVALSTEAARLGGIYHTHVRYRLGDRYLDPFREAVEISRRSGVPLHITHLFRSKSSAGGARPVLDFVEQERENGLDVTFDMLPYSSGGTRIIITLPDWVHEGGPDRMKEALRSGEARERLRQEVKPWGDGSWHDLRVTYFKQPHNLHLEGRPMDEVADMLEKHPVDALCDLLLDEDLRISYCNDVSITPLFRTLFLTLFTWSAATRS